MINGWMDLYKRCVGSINAISPIRFGRILMDLYPKERKNVVFEFYASFFKIIEKRVLKFLRKKKLFYHYRVSFIVSYDF